MSVALVFSPALGAYELAPDHPLKPERVLLAVDLIEAYGLVSSGALVRVPPRPATTQELLRVHDAEYIETVIEYSSGRSSWLAHRGIGPGDTPAFRGMHDAAALVAGAPPLAVEQVLDGAFTRAFSPAGGLHHAHRDRAAGFCVYNDVAVAIAAAIARDSRLRVLYVDIDAHHGDGVQEAFYEEPRVLTISLHETGRYLFPGTGFTDERGEGAGTGSAINVPLPMGATDECYRLAFEEVVVPAAIRFAPDLIVTQNGADAHWSDPLTTLGLTLSGYRALVEATVSLSEGLTEGRMVACGGGGYAWATIVPRAWTMVAAALAGEELPEALPESWRAEIRTYGVTPPEGLSADEAPRATESRHATLLAETHRVIESLGPV